MDIEWAIDGECQLYIVQARPETVMSKKNLTEITEYKIHNNKIEPLLSGIAVGDTISSGKVKIIMSLDKRYDVNDP